MGYHPLLSVLSAFSPQGDYFLRASTVSTQEDKKAGCCFESVAIDEKVFQESQFVFPVLYRCLGHPLIGGCSVLGRCGGRCTARLSILSLILTPLNAITD